MPKLSGRMNQHEREVCVRVRLFRESIGRTQADFSSALGITLNQLATIEYARTPLRYSIAWKIREVFGLAVGWLSNGNYPPNQPDLAPWPNPDSIENRAALLSDVEEYLAKLDPNSPAHKAAEKQWWATQTASKAVPRRRDFEELLKTKFDKCLASVPDALMSEFTGQVFEFLQSWLNDFSENSEPKASLYTRAMIWGQMRRDIDMRMPAQIDSEPSKDTLDKQNLSGSVVSMRSEVPSWPELKNTIKRLTSRRGEKKSLADKIGVSRQVLGNWLSDDSQGTPNAELTLELLKWVKGHPNKK